MNATIINLFTFLGSAYFLFLTMICSMTIKGFICISLVIRQSDRLFATRTIRLLFMILASAMLTDATWVLKLVKDLWIPSLNFKFFLFTLRISWAFTTLQYLLKILFINTLTKTSNKTRSIQHIFFAVSIFVASSFFYISIAHFDGSRTPLEFKLFGIIPLVNIILAGFCLVITLNKLQEKKVPIIIKKQLRMLITYFFAPSLFFDLLQIFPFSFTPTFFSQNLFSVSVATLVPSFALYYCVKKLLKVRFLNFNSHVQSDEPFNFINDFKEVLQNLSLVTNTKELSYLTQQFFKEALSIPITKTYFYMRHLDVSGQSERPHTAIETIVENFVTLNSNNREMIDFVKQNRLILIKDEIEFNHFSIPQTVSEQILQFLNGINASIFIPIFEKKVLTAYIIIDQDARPTMLYSDLERDEMLIFAKYIGTIEKLLRTSNLNELLTQQKELKEELFLKHQEINQYKESIHSFLRTNKSQNIGILFYKKRKFTLLNPSAKELITINLNSQFGHPLTQKIRSIAQHVEEFKTPQTVLTNNAEGEKIVLSVLYNTEHNNVIIMASYPNMADVVKKQFDTLKNPSQWDYVLYLETTKSGQLINTIIPGSGERIMTFKIALLKMALTPKAILLDMPEEDIRATVDIIHHISLKETLHIISMQNPEKDLSTGIKIFGLNPIFGSISELPLLEKLDQSGTLFVKNVHLLSLETQDYLANFIKTGSFKLIKSDHKIAAQVRLIFSTNQNLAALVQEGKFSKNLYAELEHMTLTFPPLYSLPAQELEQLSTELTEQVLHSSSFKNILALTDKEKLKLVHKKPVSLHEFKEIVQTMLINKSKKNAIYEETEFDAAYNLSDPELIEAARLGKHALRNEKTMIMLWNKFKNQNKIATFLGVNRSSISRRFKRLNIE